MSTLIYDASFEGLLTAVFEVFEYKIPGPMIFKEADANPGLFGENRMVITDKAKAERVMKKLREKLSPDAVARVYKTFLSEIPGIENHLLRYIQYNISSKKSVENDFSHPDILVLQQTSRKVHREKHRMEAFVRFQLTKDGLFYSIVQPDFNVLPLIGKHFKDRYADQRWLIYDSRRKYGLYYDLKELSEIDINFSVDLNSKEQLETIQDESEELYQRLWQQYFNSVNIPARKNMKLHIQHMPKRYWRFLIEKQSGEY